MYIFKILVRIHPVFSARIYSTVFNAFLSARTKCTCLSKSSFTVCPTYSTSLKKSPTRGGLHAQNQRLLSIFCPLVIRHCSDPCIRGQGPAALVHELHWFPNIFRPFPVSRDCSRLHRKPFRIILRAAFANFNITSRVSNGTGLSK